MDSFGHIKAITFDAAGTLMRVADPVGETYGRIAADAGAVLSPEVLEAAFVKAFAQMPPMAFPDLRGGALANAERDWWRRLVQRVVHQAGGVPAFDAYFDALFSHYASGAAWRAYPEVHATLESVRARGLRIGVISNFDSRLPPILRALGIADRVDAVIFSTGCGAAKPDARIFERALATLGVPAGATLHVGDSLDADYRGASAAGMASVHLQRRDAPNRPEVPTIRSLDELGALLER